MATKPGATNSYDKSGGLSTTIQSRGIDIGPIPDFWGDLNQIVSRLRPVPRGYGQSGPSQAGALRSAEPPPQERRYDPQGDLASQMENRQRIIAAQEASQPAPLTYRPATPGTTGGWQQDINAMDANQRKMFLPQGSSFSGGGSGGGNYGGADSDTPGLNGIAQSQAQALRNDAQRRLIEHMNDQ